MHISFVLFLAIVVCCVLGCWPVCEPRSPNNPEALPGDPTTQYIAKLDHSMRVIGGFDYDSLGNAVDDIIESDLGQKDHGVWEREVMYVNNLLGLARLPPWPSRADGVDLETVKKTLAVHWGGLIEELCYGTLAPWFGIDFTEDPQPKPQMRLSLPSSNIADLSRHGSIVFDWRDFTKRCSTRTCAFLLDKLLDSAILTRNPHLMLLVELIHTISVHISEWHRSGRVIKPGTFTVFEPDRPVSTHHINKWTLEMAPSDTQVTITRSETRLLAEIQQRCLTALLATDG